MPALLLNSEPISADRYENELKNLQGNILQGHGRAQSVFLCLRFKYDDGDPVRKINLKNKMSRLANRITSAYQQRRESQWFKENKSQTLFCSFLLTAKGYRELGLQPPRGDDAFKRGMAARSGLNDPPFEKWRKDYQQEIHAMLLLAHDDEKALDTHLKAFKELIESFAYICVEEKGAWQDKSNRREHFGYVDGKSQPLFFKGKATGGALAWNPGTGPNLLLVQDRYGGLYGYGSYFVFRKLEQDVRRFKSNVISLAERLEQISKGTAQEKEEERIQRAYALVMGRFQDGTPITSYSEPQGYSNDFNYEQDKKGLKCPSHAHIRQMNPRQKKRPDRHFIARRGIPYGDETNGGLLFMCYQATIREQFEWLQRRASGAMRDPVIGQKKNDADKQLWPSKRNSKENMQEFSFDSCVTFLGGEYFFAPSIYFLKNLSAIEPNLH